MGLRIIIAITLTLIAFTCAAEASDTQKVNLDGVIRSTDLRTLPGLATSDRVITLNTEVTASAMRFLIGKLEEFSNSPKKKVFLVINSPGGSVDAGLDFITSMVGLKETKGLKTSCVIDGMAASMAAVISAYCHETYMTPRSLMMFHGISYVVGGSSSHILEVAIFTEMWVRELNTLLAEQLGISYTDYMRFRGDERWMTAKQASFFGFANGLVRILHYKAHIPPKRVQRIIFNEAKKLRESGATQ